MLLFASHAICSPVAQLSRRGLLMVASIASLNLSRLQDGPGRVVPGLRGFDPHAVNGLPVFGLFLLMPRVLRPSASYLLRGPLPATINHLTSETTTATIYAWCAALPLSLPHGFVY